MLPSLKYNGLKDLKQTMLVQDKMVKVETEDL